MSSTSIAMAPGGVAATVPFAAYRDTAPNVEGAERLASLAGGVVLAGWGLGRGGFAGGAAVVAGAALVARGALGRDPLKRMVQARPAAQEVAASEGWAAAAVTTKSVRINRPREDVYQAWRDFERLGRILENIERIEVMDERRSHWVAKGPAGARVEWDAEVTEDEPGRRIAWRSLDGGDVKTVGEVEFEDATGGRGSIVRATLAYEPPGGEVGRIVATIFQREPVMQARRDLMRFKQFIETGEIATAEPPKAAPRGK